MKLLLYCTKSRKQLFFDKIKQIFMFGLNRKKDKFNSLNGKIVAECDFEIEDLRIVDDDPLGAYWYETKTLSENELLEKSCLTSDELYEYLGEYNDGYAIHIKNLHIFDKPKELSDYTYFRTKLFGTLGNAPQNMMYVYDNEERKVLISIRPEWLCKILNGEKTIEIRKKVLKEMLIDE